MSARDGVGEEVGIPRTEGHEEPGDSRGEARAVGSLEVVAGGGGRRVCSWAWGGELNRRDGAGGAGGGWARSWHPVLQEAGEEGRAERGRAGAPPAGAGGCTALRWAAAGRGVGVARGRVGCARKSAFMLTKMKAARSKKSDSL